MLLQYLLFHLPLSSCNFQSLTDSGNYHEFCRLLARLKSNYQLGELVKVDNYPEVIKLIAEFTITSLQVCVCSSLFWWAFVSFCRLSCCCLYAIFVVVQIFRINRDDWDQTFIAYYWQHLYNYLTCAITFLKLKSACKSYYATSKLW